MKHGRRLTLKQKEFLSSMGFDSRNYLSVKNTSEERIFVHRATRKQERFKREGSSYVHTPNARG